MGKNSKNGSEGQNADDPMNKVVQIGKQSWDDRMNGLMRAKQALVLGALSTGASMVLLFPIDIAKTLRQGSESTTVKAMQTRLLQTSPLKGILAALSAQLPGAAVTFGTFEVALRHMQRRHEEMSSRLQVILAACIGDVVGSLWITPFEHLKQQVQIGRYHNTVDGFTHMLKDYGPQGGNARSLPFYRGFVPLVLRNCGYRTLHLVVLDELRKRARKDLGRDLKLGEQLGLSAVTAAIAAFVTCPLDVLKSRLMTQRPGPGTLYHTWLEAGQRLAQREGAKGFFRGVVPRISYAAGTSVIFLLAYDRISEKVGAGRKLGEVGKARPAFVTTVAVPRKSKS